MKVAVSVDNGDVSAHFGRCKAYAIYEIEKGKIINKEIIHNPGHQPGFLPQFLAGYGVDCVITGGMGPRAQNLFKLRGIETIVGVSGNVDDVIQKFINNELEIGESKCTHSSEMHQCQHGYSYSQKICITSKGNNLDSEVDPRFGRAKYLLIIDLDTMSYKAIENPYREEPQGAGIKTAQFIINEKIDVLLTGNIGLNAFEILNTAGVKTVTGASGPIKEIITEYKKRLKLWDSLFWR